MMLLLKQLLVKLLHLSLIQKLYRILDVIKIAQVIHLLKLLKLLKMLPKLRIHEQGIHCIRLHELLMKHLLLLKR